MITIPEIYSEITNKLKQYDESNLIDEISVNNWIRKSIKEFAGNSMQEEEVTLLVENGRAKLPPNFYSLILALKCNPESYTYESEEGKAHIQSSYFYEERLEQSTEFDNTLGQQPCLTGDCKRVVQSVYWIDRDNKRRKAGDIHYSNINLLKIKRGYKKQKCDLGCPNLRVTDSKYEISVFDYNYIQTNFESGYIYIRFKGLPTNDHGELIVPTTHRDSLKEYIIYNCSRRILEDIWLNGDDPNAVNKLQYLKAEESRTYQEARSEMFVEGMRGWADSVREQNKRRTRRFEYMINYI